MVARDSSDLEIRPASYHGCPDSLLFDGGKLVTVISLRIPLAAAKRLSRFQLR